VVDVMPRGKGGLWWLWGFWTPGESCLPSGASVSVSAAAAASAAAASAAPLPEQMSHVISQKLFPRSLPTEKPKANVCSVVLWWCFGGLGGVSSTSGAYCLVVASCGDPRTAADYHQKIGTERRDKSEDASSRVSGCLASFVVAPSLG